MLTGREGANPCSDFNRFMFKRRHPLRFARRVRELIWPTMGWKRVSLYIGHRLVRLKESNYSIAMGITLGAAVSFTPTPGTHLIQAALFSILLRANVFASVIGTLVGNPWTIPLMWWLSFEVGRAVFGIFGLEVGVMPAEFSWDAYVGEIKSHPWEFFIPWLVGGYITAILSMPLFYGLSYWLILQARAYQVRWKQRRMHKDAKEITGQKS